MSRILAITTRVLLALPLVAGLLAVAPAAAAQSAATATIPFAFSADSYKLPAGTYRIDMISNQVLAFRNVTTGKTHCLMVLPDWSSNPPSRGSLVFHRYGNQSYLYKVSIAGRSGNSEFLKSHAEREMLKSIKEAKNEGKADTPVSQVEVALNASGASGH
jgi:hypothetical protein